MASSSPLALHAGPRGCDSSSSLNTRHSQDSTLGVFLRLSFCGSKDEALFVNRLSVSKKDSQRNFSIVCSAEPKWKQKLAAADAQAEKIRQLTSQAAEEYRRKQAAQRGSTEKANIQPLSSLEFIPFLDENGFINDCSEPTAKATVYAVFDEQKVLQYVGISRQVYQSMRLHFARMTNECHYIKLMNITKPSRTILENTKEEWIKENQSVPVGNDNGPVQFRWENAIDCKLLMTEEEKELVEASPAGPSKKRALKNVARRIQVEVEAKFKERNCREALRFDPKLKDEGFLDLKSTARAPDKSIPENPSP